MSPRRRPAPTYLTLAEVAERAGVKVTSARQYHKEASARRAAGAPRPGDLPEPDVQLGQTPGWAEATVQAWLERRPRAAQRSA